MRTGSDSDRELGSYGSHLPALLRMVSATDGPVLEFGCGYWSTPVLHEVCGVLQRELTSFETDPLYLAEFEYLQAREGAKASHELVHLDQWIVPEHHWDRRYAVALIDCAPPAARLPLLEFSRPHVDFVVCHDTNPEVERAYWEDALSTFRYRRDYRPQIAWHPWTSVVSDRVAIP